MCTMIHLAVDPLAVDLMRPMLESSFRVRPVEVSDELRGVFGDGMSILQVDGGYCGCGLLFRKDAPGAKKHRAASGHEGPAFDPRQHGAAPTAETLRSTVAAIVRMAGQATLFAHEAHEPAEVRDAVRATLQDLERGAVGLDDGTLLTVVRDEWRLEL